MTEYIVIFGIALIFFAIMISVLGGQIGENMQKRHQDAVDAQGQRLQNEMLAAYTADTGYYTTYIFSPPYGGIMMSIYINNTLAVINSSRASIRISIPKVYGSVKGGSANFTIYKNSTGSTIIS